MTALTESLHAGGFMVSEADGYHCREKINIAVSQTLVAGQVLGASAIIAGATASAAADASNTSGSGAITLDGTTPVLAGAKNGVYRVVCIEPATNGGIFAVFDPNGVEIGTVAVAATFAKEIKFVIADATDFAAGDAFSVTVGIEQSDREYKAFDTTATDGAQRVAGILWDAVTTDGSNRGIGAAIVRGPCQVRGSDLTWPASDLTDAQKAAAIADLASLGIIVR
jgi:hypothetical protein